MKSRNKKLPNAKIYSTVDHKAYVFYRENSKLATRQLVQHFVEYGKIMRCFYEIVEDSLADNLNGVYLEGLGYFGMFKYQEYPRFKPWYMWEKTKINLSEVYFPIFVPISTSIIDRLYVMESSFTTRVKKRITKRIREGFHYMFTPSAFYYKLRNHDKKTVSS